MKRRYFRKKRRVYRRKTYRKRRPQSRKYAVKAQRASLTYTRKRYLKVEVLDINGTDESNQFTISHFGGRNQQGPASTITLPDCGQDDQLKQDMGLHQYFRITGISYKLIFPGFTDLRNTPVQWTITYSGTKIISPFLKPDRLQTLATYQTGGCDPTKPISRYFKTYKAMKRMGIDWMPCADYLQLASSPPVNTYNGQLPPDQGSSSHIRVYRKKPTAIGNGTVGRVEVTYYVAYKGQKGVSSITVQ